MLSGATARSTITSLSFCELYTIQKADLQALRVNFPDTFGGFEQAAKLEEKNANKAARSKKFSRQNTVNLSGAASGGARKGWRNFVILPKSRLRALWACGVYLSLGYDALILPIKLVFIGNALLPSVMALDVACDLFLLLDLALQFRLAFHVDGRLVDDRREIRSYYLYGITSDRQAGGMRARQAKSLRTMITKGAFFPTMISSLPCSLLCVLFAAGADARALQTPRLIRLVRLVPMLLTGNIVRRQQPSGIDELLHQVRSSAFDLQYTTHKLVPLVCAYILLAHYAACGYWATVLASIPPFEFDFGVIFLDMREVANVTLLANATLQADGYYHPWADSRRVYELWDNSEWLPHPKSLRLGNVLIWYLRSLYYSVCNLTGLGKSPVPMKNLSLIYTTFTFIVGVLVFAYITSSIVTLVMNANAPMVSFQSKRHALLGFMSTSHVDKTIVQRASKWLDHWWFAHGGTPAGYVIDQLPPSLSKEMRHLVFQKTTQNSKAFLPLWEHLKKKPKKRPAGGGAGDDAADAEEAERKQATNESIIREMIRDMEFEVYNPGEWVLHKGMLNDFFYIVTVGSAEVLLAEGSDEPGRAGVLTAHLAGKTIAELGAGEVFGEISAMYLSKCEASVRAKEPLEVFAIPRLTMMRSLHRHEALMRHMLELIRLRRKENTYFVEGSLNVGRTAIAMIAAHKLAMWIRKRMEQKAKMIEALPEEAVAEAASKMEGLNGFFAKRRVSELEEVKRRSIRASESDHDEESGHDGGALAPSPAGRGPPRVQIDTRDSITTVRL